VTDKNKNPDQDQLFNPDDLAALEQVREEAKSLPPDELTGSRSADSDLAAGITAAKRMVGEVTQLPPAAEQVLNEPSDAWEDIGGGNRLKKRSDHLSKFIGDTVAEIDSTRPEASTDKNGYKLLQGLRIVNAVYQAPGQSISGYVEAKVRAFGGKTSLEAKYNSVRDYDSLIILKNAFDKLVKSEKTGQRSDELVEDFFEVNYPSSLWQDPEIKENILEAVDAAYELVGIMTTHNHDSIRAFLTKAQHEFLRQGTDLKPPTKRSHPASKRAFENAQKQAWQEFLTE
jgi:hypothetical protein